MDAYTSATSLKFVFLLVPSENSFILCMTTSMHEYKRQSENVHEQIMYRLLSSSNKGKAARFSITLDYLSSRKVTQLFYQLYCWVLINMLSTLLWRYLVSVAATEH